MKKDKQYYLFAKEDIYDEYHRNVLYLKDELIGEVSVLKRTKDVSVLPKGMYYLQRKDKQNDFQEVHVEEKLENWKYFENVLVLKQMVSIDLKIIDSHTKEFINGVHCGVFAGENIMDEKGRIIYLKDDLVMDVTSEESKLIKVPLLDIRQGTFYIQQLDVVDGYYGNTEQLKMEVDFDLKFVNFSIMIENQPTMVEVRKLDEKGDFLKGVWLAVYDSQGVLVDEWISEKEHILYNLGIGKTYVIKEIETVKGYSLIPEFYFTVENHKGVQKIELINKKNSEKGKDDDNKVMC